MYTSRKLLFNSLLQRIFQQNQIRFHQIPKAHKQSSKNVLTLIHIQQSSFIFYQ